MAGNSTASTLFRGRYSTEVPLDSMTGSSTTGSSTTGAAWIGVSMGASMGASTTGVSTISTIEGDIVAVCDGREYYIMVVRRDCRRGYVQLEQV